MICMNCQSKLPDNAEICSHCGAVVRIRPQDRLEDAQQIEALKKVSEMMRRRRTAEAEASATPEEERPAETLPEDAAFPETETAAAEELPAAAEKMTAAEELPAAAEEMPAAEETPADAEEMTAAEETPADAEEMPAHEETPADAEEIPAEEIPVAEETAAGAEEPAAESAEEAPAAEGSAEDTAEGSTEETSSEEAPAEREYATPFTKFLWSVVYYIRDFFVAIGMAFVGVFRAAAAPFTTGRAQRKAELEHHYERLERSRTRRKKTNFEKYIVTLVILVLIAVCAVVYLLKDRGSDRQDTQVQYGTQEESQE